MPFAEIKYAGTPWKGYTLRRSEQWDRVVLESRRSTLRAKLIAVFICLQIFVDDGVGIFPDPHLLFHPRGRWLIAFRTVSELQEYQYICSLKRSSRERTNSDVKNQYELMMKI
jgi:hypothetical protein